MLITINNRDHEHNEENKFESHDQSNSRLNPERLYRESDIIDLVRKRVFLSMQNQNSLKKTRTLQENNWKMIINSQRHGDELD